MPNVRFTLFCSLKFLRAWHRQTIIAVIMIAGAVSLLVLTNAMLRSEIEDNLEKVLDRVGLFHRLNSRPSSMSGGEQQRCAIARALVTSPKIILADEPTGNLDSSAKMEVMTLLKEVNMAGITVIAVTHDPEVAACAGTRVKLRDGSIEIVEES